MSVIVGRFKQILRNNPKLRKVLKLRYNRPTNELFSYLLDKRNRMADNLSECLSYNRRNLKECLEKKLGLQLEWVDDIADSGTYILIQNARVSIITNKLVIGRTCADEITLRQKYSNEGLRLFKKLKVVEYET